jgi:hypothetical protein
VTENETRAFTAEFAEGPQRSRRKSEGENQPKTKVPKGGTWMLGKRKVKTRTLENHKGAAPNFA